LSSRSFRPRNVGEFKLPLNWSRLVQPRLRASHVSRTGRNLQSTVPNIRRGNVSMRSLKSAVLSRGCAGRATRSSPYRRGLRSRWCRRRPSGDFTKGRSRTRGISAARRNAIKEVVVEELRPRNVGEFKLPLNWSRLVQARLRASHVSRRGLCTHGGRT
jgi:hypothetical protein